MKIINKKKLLKEIEEAYLSAQEDNWDGYEASKVSEKNKELSLKIAEILPDNVKHPTVVPDPDGSLSFEFYVRRDFVFSLGNDDKNFIYAGVFNDGNKVYGETRLRRPLPEEIKLILEKYFLIKEGENINGKEKN